MALSARVPPRLNAVLGALVFALVGALALVFPHAAAATRLLPVDEAARDPGFFSFRARLLTAIARHDTAGVVSALDPGIKLSFGGDGGIAGFRRMWKPGSRDSRLWQELGEVLALGGSFDAQNRFVAPYTFSRWPESIDAYWHLAVIGDKVRVRDAPRANAATIGTVSFEIVRLPPAKKSRPAVPGWTPVLTASGLTGWVASSLLRSPIALRAIFERRAGGWRLAALVSGD